MWTPEHIVELDKMRDVRGPRGTSEWAWHWLCLGLLINRHCPEAFDDDVVERELHRVWNEQCGDIPFLVED